MPANVTQFPSPPNPVGAAGPFNYLPWEVGDRQGGRFATRQELDWPFQLGPVKVVPYALGEAAHWDRFRRTIVYKKGGCESHFLPLCLVFFFKI